jgi:hypothetical protein
MLYSKMKLHVSAFIDHLQVSIILRRIYEALYILLKYYRILKMVNEGRNM